MARASALLADWAQFAKAHKRALKALKSAEKSAQSAQQVVAGEEGSRGAVVGGKQGWRVRDDSRQNSANVFDAHRRDELQKELAEIDAYRTRVERDSDAGAAAEEADGAKGAQAQEAQAKQLLKLLVFMRRVVSCYIYGTLPKP